MAARLNKQVLAGCKQGVVHTLLIQVDHAMGGRKQVRKSKCHRQSSTEHDIALTSRLLSPLGLRLPRMQNWLWLCLTGRKSGQGFSRRHRGYVWNAVSRSVLWRQLCAGTRLNTSSTGSYSIRSFIYIRMPTARLYVGAPIYELSTALDIYTCTQTHRPSAENAESTVLLLQSAVHHARLGTHRVFKQRHRTQHPFARQRAQSGMQSGCKGAHDAAEASTFPSARDSFPL